MDCLAKDKKSISICCFNCVGHTEMILPKDFGA